MKSTPQKNTVYSLESKYGEITVRDYPFSKLFNLNFFINIITIIFLIHSAWNADSLLFALEAITKAIAIVSTMTCKWIEAIEANKPAGGKTTGRA
ncbi:hypothetical protein ACQFG6_001877 [Klebsiella michiganensis]|uniref:hypothetical protein n=1 Tax=Klebsiella michiganensis TaxID=1134687 RepID=UPI001D0F0B23|nr:hypothetical protein [Klebsiella michiganensis]